MAFTWTPFYKELSDWLLEKQDSQSDLISILKKIGITGYRDGTEKGKKIEQNKQLEALGIDKSTLFPKVEHVAEHIREKYHISK